MPSIFTKIINREIPAYIIAENDDFMAFLDISPLTIGHSLVIPKVEVDYIYDLEDDVLTELHLFAKKVAKGIEASVICERIGLTVMGLEVPHAHVHLIPMNSMSDMNFSKTKFDPSQEEMKKLSAKISKNIKLK